MASRTKLPVRQSPAALYPGPPRHRLPVETETANRPLRMLFMATSPEDVHPVLDFEVKSADS